MKKMFLALTLGLLGWAGNAALAEESRLDAAALFEESCARCHGADGSGAPGGTTPLREQTAAAITQKLEGYKAGTYGGERKEVMERVAGELSGEQIAALAGQVGKAGE